MTKTWFTKGDVAAWVAQASGTTKQLASVAPEGPQIVIVGDSGTILTSPDGVSWTSQKSATYWH
jgi:hypothetical protein